MNRTASPGFTLVELMITVVIIGILAGIAYPSYQKWTREARRTDAHIALTRTASDLEKFFSECFRYTSSFTAARDCTNAGLGYPNNLSTEQYYSLAITASNLSTDYTITATAQGRQAGDTNCLTLSLDSLGRKTPNPDPNRCWKR